ncbi:MAG: hypothetical protein LDLANPLL_01352 [Turneriella sp.]|nr:hypothetical protein [Turneriella sp.]
MLDSEFDEKSLEGIESGKRFFIKSYGLAKSTEVLLQKAIRHIMQHLKRPDLALSVECLLRELTMNAAKANFKKIFFSENGINSNNIDQYARGMLAFREALCTEMFNEYSQKAKKADLHILIALDYNEDRVILEVRNNVPMSIAEEERVREKLRAAMQTTDFAQLFTENVDETEGAGLGLMLCLTALRSSNIDPRLLSISTDYKKETVARAEFPLRAEYIPARKMWSEKQAV